MTQKSWKNFVSLGREFQTDDPFEAKQFWLFLDFSPRGLRLKFELHKVLLAISETQVNCSARYIGASAFNALYTLFADSCLIMSEILGSCSCLGRGPTDASYALFVIIQMALFCNLSRVLRVVTPHESQTKQQYLG